MGRQPTDFHRPHGADGIERAGNFSQSTLSGKVRTISHNLYTSTRTKRVDRLHGRDSVELLDPVALKILSEMPQPNVAAEHNLHNNIYENTQYRNFSERVDWNITDNSKDSSRATVSSRPTSTRPDRRRLLPLGEKTRYSPSAAADSVWVMSSKPTFWGSYGSMTDEFYNPSLLLGEEGLQDYSPNNPWYSSLYNSGYVYYPALDATSTGTATTNRLGRQGREWCSQRPTGTMSAKNELVRGQADTKYAKCARLVRRRPLSASISCSTRTRRPRLHSPDTVNTGNHELPMGRAGRPDAGDRAAADPGFAGLRRLFPG